MYKVIISLLFFGSSLYAADLDGVWQAQLPEFGGQIQVKWTINGSSLISESVCYPSSNYEMKVSAESVVSIEGNIISILKPGYNFIQSDGFHSCSSGFEAQTEFRILNSRSDILIIEAQGKSINFSRAR